MHEPLNVDFNRALAGVAMGKGKGKQAAKALQHAPQKHVPEKTETASNASEARGKK
jgi:hypothetical protein